MRGTKPSKKCLNRRRWNTDQSWHFEALYQIRGRAVRARIRRNAYDNQSSRVAELFDGDKWNVLVALPIGSEFKDVSYVQPNVTGPQVGLFEKAADDLADEVEQLLAIHAGE